MNLEHSQTPAARALMSLQREIVSSWEKSARREIDAAAKLSHPILLDTVPQFLKNLAEALDEEHPRVLAPEGPSVPEGGVRARLSRYAPDQLIHEYELLRNTILEKLGKEVSLTERDRSIILASVDQAVREAVTAFFSIHNRIRENFVASLTHDLRQPLSAAKMAADLILQSQDTDDAKMFAQKIVTNAKRVDRMIQDLLDATVIQFGQRIPLKLSKCCVASLVADLISDFDPREIRRLRVHMAPRVCCWDPEAIRRAVWNLIINAFKYGRIGGPVTVNVEHKDGNVTISVHNEGSPIPSTEREQLFEPFRRSEKAKRSGKIGWGIGLALVRAVAEAHGGSVVVESSEARGTTFTLDMPCDATPFQNDHVVN